MRIVSHSSRNQRDVRCGSAGSPARHGTAHTQRTRHCVAAVFATGDGSGQLDIWNLNHSVEMPLERVRAADRCCSRLLLRCAVWICVVCRVLLLLRCMPHAGWRDAVRKSLSVRGAHGVHTEATCCSQRATTHNIRSHALVSQRSERAPAPAELQWQQCYGHRRYVVALAAHRCSLVLSPTAAEILAWCPRRAISRIKWSQSGRQIVAGDSSGCLTLFNVVGDVPLPPPSLPTAAHPPPASTSPTPLPRPPSARASLLRPAVAV